jgi:site-specific recombinase XerD
MQDGLPVVEEYLTGLDGVSELTLRNYKSVLLNFSHWFRVVVKEQFSPENISIMDLRDYVKYLSNNQSLRSSSIRTQILIIQTWIYRTTNHRLGYVAVPADKDRLPQPTYRDMRNQLVSNAEKSRCLRDVALVRLLTTAGHRVSRIISLRARDIDLDNRRIRVLGGAVPLTAKTAHVLEQYIAEERLSPCDYLFRSPSRNRHISDRAARNILSRYGDCSPEDLRRAMEEDLSAKGGATQVVDAIMGRRGKAPHLRVEFRALQRACETGEA